MARRGKNSIKPLWIVIGAIILIGAFFGSQLFLTGASDPFRTYPSLDVQAYLENANSLRSNTYKLKGEVANSLAWSPTMGRLISVNVEGGTDVVPILVTPKFNQINIQKGQKLIFLLEVDENGMLRTKNLTKA